MLWSDQIRAWARSYRGAEASRYWLGAGAIADRMRLGIPWWMGLLMLAMLLVMPNVMAGRLSKVWLQFPGLDKPTHCFVFIAVYAIVYGVLRSKGWPATDQGKLTAAVVLSLLIAVADEAQQAILGRGRTAEYGDLVADVAGILIGLTCVNVGQLGMRRAVGIAVLLLVPVVAVTAKTYHDLKHFNRGMVYEREHDYQRAKAEYMLALDSGFQSSEIYNTVAWLDIEFLGANLVEAEQYAARAFEMDPDNPDIMDTYGWVLVKVGRSREGLSLLERAKTLKPNMYCIDLHLGVAYREAGMRDRAVEYLKRQIGRNSSDRWGQSARVALDQMEGQAG